MIEIKDIEKLANLSRIHLGEEEKVKLLGDMNSILGYVEEIKKVSADSGVEVTYPSSNVLREDGISHEMDVDTEAILKNAPEREDNYVKVKKILG